MSRGKATLAGIAALAVALATPAIGAAKSWKFSLTNNSNKEVVEFRTQEDGEWSENWIDARIEAGDEIELDFETDEGACQVRTQVRFTDGTYFDADVDYCAADKLVIVDDQTMIWKKE